MTRAAYTYTDQDIKQYASMWAQGMSGIKIAHEMKKTAKEADAIYQAAKKRGLIAPRNNRKLPLRKHSRVQIAPAHSAQEKLISTVDAEAHKMGQVAKFAWEVLKAQL